MLKSLEQGLCVRYVGIRWWLCEGGGVVVEVCEWAWCFGAGGCVADDEAVAAGAGDGDVDELACGPDPVEGAGFGAGGDAW